MKWKHEHFETVISTNDTALQYPPFTIVTANTQTGGRGRYGRNWTSDTGNLFFSAVLPTESELTPFAVGLAVAEALAPHPVQLKWPNDVLLDGRKIAGVLMERVDNGLIIGIGINLISAPTDTPYPTGHLGGILSTETVTEQLAKNLLKYHQTDFETVRKEWLKKACGIGHPITARLASETVTGTFIDLSRAGALILQMPDNTIKEIVAGDIFLEKDIK